MEKKRKSVRRVNFSDGFFSSHSEYEDLELPKDNDMTNLHKMISLKTFSHHHSTAKVTPAPSEHPYKNEGGITPLVLQTELAKLPKSSSRSGAILAV